jgi:hypothetical protein
LSHTGSQNPLNELIATLAALQTSSDTLNAHPQCKFRGRYYWLERQFDFTELNITPVRYPEYDNFANKQNIKSFSLIFATGYLGNPASYYDHLLLKLNTSTDNATELEDTFINYGAKVPANENMATYITKGLIGSYSSTFTADKFYFHKHAYNDNALRDLWEYELNFDDTTNQLLVAHIWEMLNVSHNYYFFNRNCAYRMAELIELATDKPFTQDNLPWEAPQSILQKLSSATYRGQPVIKSINYIPSKQSKLYQKYTQLNDDGKVAVNAAIDDIATLTTKKFDTQNTTAAVRVLDTLIDYYHFISPEKEHPDNEEYRKTLSKRFSLPVSTPDFTLNSNSNPHLGHSPSYITAGVRNNSELGMGISLRLRPAYYDILDASYGHVRGASLSMVDVSLTQYSSTTTIDYIKIVAIENLNGHTTKLPGDKSFAWNMLVGAEQESNACKGCLGYITTFGGGYTVSSLQGNLLLNTMINVGVKGNNLNSDILHVDARLFVNYSFNNKFSVTTSATHREYFNTNDHHVLTNIAKRYELAQNWDTRWSIDKDRETAINASIGFYW